MTTMKFIRNFLKISIGTIRCPIVLSLRDDFGGSITLIQRSLAFYSNRRKLIQGYLAAFAGRVTDMFNLDKFISVITLQKLIFHLIETFFYKSQNRELDCTSGTCYRGNTKLWKTCPFQLFFLGLF